MEVCIFMSTATLTSKGQATIPKDVREHLHLSTGDKLDFIMQSNGCVILRPATIDITRLKGLLYRPGQKPVSIEDMNRAIIDGATDSQT